ncbi:MAG: cell division protein FtsZ, partial [Methanomassiliicoccales archaeon]
MKSLVSDALSRAGEEADDSQPPYQNYSAADEELEHILSGLKTNIKIMGCGGGGSNTITRLVDAGVVGAELYAANTDAQHLLAVRAPNKVLLGRRSTRGLGAGALPQVGEESAREVEEELRKIMT